MSLTALLSRNCLYRLFLAVTLVLSARTQVAYSVANDCFNITVVDEQTGRGVPLVELRTAAVWPQR